MDGNLLASIVSLIVFIPTFALFYYCIKRLDESGPVFLFPGLAALISLFCTVGFFHDYAYSRGQIDALSGRAIRYELKENDKGEKVYTYIRLPTTKESK